MSTYDIVYEDAQRVRSLILSGFNKNEVHHLASGIKTVFVSAPDAFTVMVLIPSEVVKGFGFKGCCSSTLAGLLYIGTGPSSEDATRFVKLANSVEVTYLSNDTGCVLRFPAKG